MILHLFRRPPRAATIASFYGMIVAQARRPVFYRSYLVPDTVNGRFEMVTLHTVLVLRRLEGETGPLRRLGQGLFDAFCQDMDASMREMGVGDLTVPKKMRRIGEAFYGRLATYRDALAAPDAGVLVAALNRNVFSGAADEPGAGLLAAYMRAVSGALARTDEAALMRAEPRFPDPDSIAAPEHVARAGMVP
jgi:cytochrome b pre-mRNA-processing protein 3